MRERERERERERVERVRRVEELRKKEREGSKKKGERANEARLGVCNLPPSRLSPLSLSPFTPLSNTHIHSPKSGHDSDDGSGIAGEDGAVGRRRGWSGEGEQEEQHCRRRRGERKQRR